MEMPAGIVREEEFTRMAIEIVSTGDDRFEA